MEQSDDPLDGLEERLLSHANAFQSMLALTPAREHYGSQIVDGKDPSEQWKRSKQTKEEKWAAKKAKLDPANQKSALDVMKERERKRKRELGMEDEDGDTVDGDIRNGRSEKRPRVEPDADAEEAKRRTKAERRKEKRQFKREKLARKKAKAEAKKAAKQERDLEQTQTEELLVARPNESADLDFDDKSPASHFGELDKFDASGLAGLDEALGNNEEAELEADAVDDVAQDWDVSSAPTSLNGDSPAFDIATNQSTASSSSSIQPPSLSEQPQQQPEKKQVPPKPKVDTSIAALANVEFHKKAVDSPSGTSSPKIQLPNIDQAKLQERLRLRIEELRAKRKADGPEGKPAKSRQELLEQRRKKEEQRKAAKKEQRRKAKEEEQRKREEQLRGSGSPLSADIFKPRSSQGSPDNNFSFSRLAFEDGTSSNPALTGLNGPKKGKGPQDPQTALEAAQHKQARVAGYDAEKRANIAEKDTWLNAKKRAHGERMRDDTSLLKKALKRKEKQKSKSERQWQERENAVEKGREMKQKKREANLQKRRDDKGGKGKKKGGHGGKGGGKKKGRPGFEGRFKA